VLDQSKDTASLKSDEPAEDFFIVNVTWDAVLSQLRYKVMVHLVVELGWKCRDIVVPSIDGWVIDIEDVSKYIDTGEKSLLYGQNRSSSGSFPSGNPASWTK
jgi:hypothetical protein